MPANQWGQNCPCELLQDKCQKNTCQWNYQTLQLMIADMFGVPNDQSAQLVLQFLVHFPIMILQKSKKYSDHDFVDNDHPLSSAS